MAATLKISLIGLQIGLCCSLYGATNTNTYKLALFIVKTAPKPALIGKPFDRNAIKLLDEPLLSDPDFVSYDRKTHAFSITADAARRMAKQLKSDNPRTLPNGESAFVMDIDELHGQAFVVVADGEIIYVGALSSPHSSFTPYPIPTISVFEVVRVDSKAPVRFKISSEKHDSPPPSGGTWLSKLKRWRAKVEDADVRSDRRVMNALKELGL
jgi:hypothetical protein